MILTGAEVRDLQNLGVSADVYRYRIKPLLCGKCALVEGCDLGELADEAYMNTVTRLPPEE